MSFINDYTIQTILNLSQMKMNNALFTITFQYLFYLLENHI